MDSPGAARYTDLEFNAPLSSTHARELIATLQPLRGAAIVDLGCGWAEFLLQVLETEPTAQAVGIDRDSALIARARSNAEARGLHDRLRLECADAAAWSGPADIAVVVGSSHAWGGTRATLEALRRLLGPGGRVLLGEGIWEQPPTDAAARGPRRPARRFRHVPRPGRPRPGMWIRTAHAVNRDTGGVGQLRVALASPVANVGSRRTRTRPRRTTYAPRSMTTATVTGAVTAAPSDSHTSRSSSLHAESGHVVSDRGSLIRAKRSCQDHPMRDPIAVPTMAGTPRAPAEPPFRPGRRT